MSGIISSCNIKPPVVGDPEDFELKKLDLKEIKVKIWLPIENPNNLDFNVNKVDLFVYVNGLKLGRITQFDKVHVPKNSNDIYAINVGVKLKDLSVSAFSALRQLKSKYVNLKIEGDVTVSKFFIVKKVEVEVDDKIKVW